jgi:NAD-dependent histone deacetylase SIR2
MIYLYTSVTTLMIYQSNLSKYNLPYPQAVFELEFFRRNPEPCTPISLSLLTSTKPYPGLVYALARELYPGRFRPTLSHSFIRLLNEKGLLLKCFTQNCDGLEHLAGVPDNRIVEVHGSFSTQRCIDCHAPYDHDLMKICIQQKNIPRCGTCGGLVKPDVTFLGEAVGGHLLISLRAVTHLSNQLPPEFTNSIPLVYEADLLIVIGTSLNVRHFSRLTTLVKDKCPRVLINRERAGDFGNRAGDILLLGNCDERVNELCLELKWEAKLDQLWKATEKGKGTLLKSYDFNTIQWIIAKCSHRALICLLIICASLYAILYRIR